MNDSCANVFWNRSGARSGPVKNGDTTRCDSTRSLRTVPVPLQTPPAHPVTYDGAVFRPLLSGVEGAGAGVRGAAAAGANPASQPVTTLPGLS